VTTTATDTIVVKLTWNNTFVRNSSWCDFCDTEIYWKDSEAWGTFERPVPDAGGRCDGNVCLSCLTAGEAAARTRSPIEYRHEADAASIPIDHGNVTDARAISLWWGRQADGRAYRQLMGYNFKFDLSEKEQAWVKHVAGHNHDEDGDLAIGGSCKTCHELQVAAGDPHFADDNTAGSADSAVNPDDMPF
jgi:hypothetical protein